MTPVVPRRSEETRHRGASWTRPDVRRVLRDEFLLEVCPLVRGDAGLSLSPGSWKEFSFSTNLSPSPLEPAPPRRLTAGEDED